MTDWKMMARSIGLAVAEDEIERTTAPLEALDEFIESLARKVTPELEPAMIFDASEAEQ